jgi:6,7-dimethyl-8-ribityllumazine synthase
MTSPDSPRVGVSPDAKSELQTGRAPELDGTGLRVAIACARFNDVLTSALLEDCRKHLEGFGVAEIREEWVPGAFELPLVAKRFAATGRWDAVIVLGAVVRGDTPHFDYVAGECAAGVMRGSLETGVPIVFGVLTTDTVEQARERLDKGVEFAAAAVEMAQVLRAIG